MFVCLHSIDPPLMTINGKKACAFLGKNSDKQFSPCPEEPGSDHHHHRLYIYVCKFSNQMMLCHIYIIKYFPKIFQNIVPFLAIPNPFEIKKLNIPTSTLSLLPRRIIGNPVTVDFKTH